MFMPDTVHWKGGNGMENTSSDFTAEGGGSDTGNVVAEQVRQGTQQAVHGAQNAVGQVTDQAMQQAQTMFDRQKGQATHMLHDVSGAVRQSGQSLQQSQPAAAGLMNNVADRIDGAAAFLEQRNLPQLVDETERLARRNSGYFLGGAFAVGLLAARFLKSSTPRSSYRGQGYSDQSYGYGSYYGDQGGYGSYAPTSGYGYDGAQDTGAYASNSVGTGASFTQGTTDYTTDSLDLPDRETEMGVTDGTSI